MLLSHLPQDLLRHLGTYLIADDVFRLYHTTSVLQTLYESPNFHQALRFNLLPNAGLRFPSLVLESSNLLELDLKGYYIPAFRSLILHASEKLRTLRINFFHGLQDLYSHPRYPTLYDMLPHLRELEIGLRCWFVPSWDNTFWPTSLTSLVAPQRLFYGANISNLPENLLRLHVRLIDCQGVQMPHFLTSLDARCVSGFQLPKTLTHLQADGPISAIPGIDSLKDLKSLSISIDACSASPPVFPPTLTRLEMRNQKYGEIIPFSLPAGLTSLSWTNGVLTFQPSFSAFIQSLPRSLTTIELSCSDNISTAEQIAALPPSLRSWKGVLFDAKFFATNAPTPQIRSFGTSHLIPGVHPTLGPVTDLRVTNPSLEHFSHAYTQSFSSLTTLTVLEFDYIEFPVKDLILWSWPSSLTSIYFRVDYDPTASLEPVAWPPNLVKLTISVHSQSKDPKVLLSRLPNSLRFLALTIYSLPAATLSILPNRLETLLIQELTRPTLADVLALSPRLTHLLLPADLSEDIMVLCSLPKSLTKLNLIPTAINFDKIEVLKAALPLLTFFQRQTFDRTAT